ncbi:MAG: hypothetical protein U0790_06855 [Isosphaeraceae bacterium]
MSRRRQRKEKPAKKNAELHKALPIVGRRGNAAEILARRSRELGAAVMPPPARR